jgi:hypothetical protein
VIGVKEGETTTLVRACKCEATVVANMTAHAKGHSKVNAKAA